MTKNNNSATVTTSLAHTFDALDISLDPNSMTVGDLLGLLSRYPADAPIGLGFFESDNKRCKKPDFYAMTRIVFGSVPANEVLHVDESDKSDVEAVVFMFDSGITGEEFDGPHDGDRDHGAAMIESAATAQQAEPAPKRRRSSKAVAAAIAAPNSNVVGFTLPPLPQRVRK